MITTKLLASSLAVLMFATPVAALAQGSTSSSSVTTQISSVKLPGGTPVVVRLMNEVSGNSSVNGTNIDFRVVGDVKVNNAVLISDGTVGHAQVTTSDKNGLIGQGGTVTISDFNVKAVDGTRVPLVATLSQQGKDKTVMSVGLSLIFCGLFLLMKGEEAKIPAGTEKTVYTSVDVNVTP